MALDSGLGGFMNSEMKTAVRRDRIYKGLERMPLSCFNFGEYRILRRFIENRGCSEADIAYIEDKIKEFNERQPTFCEKCRAVLTNDPNHQCQSKGDANAG